MRNLKFRAWNNDLQCYFYAPNDTWSIVFHAESAVAQMWCSDGLVDEIPVDAIEQFTGLTDKNGSEIYEGDIVCETGMDLAQPHDYTVIGNIHENPELLK